MQQQRLGGHRSAQQWFQQGHDRLRAGDLAGALDAFRASLKANPRVAASWMGLAQVLEANSQFEDARECLRQAIKVAPKHEGARRALARAHQGLGEVTLAEQEYREALRLAPGSAAAHFGLGQLLEDVGRREEAGEAYRKALDLEPDLHEARANLLGVAAKADLPQAVAEAQSRIPAADDRGTALLGYGLGKALDREGKYDAAFEAIEIANEARKAQHGAFDRAAFDRRIERMIALFSEEFFVERRDWGDPSERPVFIVGLPRSGTTLTEQILASHHACFGAGELPVLSDLATGTPDRLGDARAAWPDCADRLSRAQIDAIGGDYLAASGQRAPAGATRVIDKQPLNFWYLGLVAIAMPNARIVHCTRDIRDCGFSIYSQNFNVEQRWATDLDDIAHYWRGYRRLMEHWQAVTGLPMLDVAYEDTVADLEGTARSLLGFAGLDWDERVLAFHEAERAVQTPSKWQVRQPIYQTSKARWRHYEPYLGPLIEAAGLGDD